MKQLQFQGKLFRTNWERNNLLNYFQVRRRETQIAINFRLMPTATGEGFQTSNKQEVV